MKKSRFTESQIVAILKEGEGGVAVAQLTRKHGISAATYYHWQSKYAGAVVAELKRLRDLEAENAKLKSRPACASNVLSFAHPGLYRERGTTPASFRPPIAAARTEGDPPVISGQGALRDPRRAPARGYRRSRGSGAHHIQRVFPAVGAGVSASVHRYSRTRARAIQCLPDSPLQNAGVQSRPAAGAGSKQLTPNSKDHVPPCEDDIRDGIGGSPEGIVNLGWG
jgi:putative transposase